MTNPIVYSWDDVGAPVVSGTDLLSLHKLFKACLVDGYGDKSGAGWTLEYTGTDPSMGGTDNTVYCFRQGGGNRRFFQVGAASSNLANAGIHTGNWAAAVVRGYDYMYSATEGAGMFPNVPPKFYTNDGLTCDYGFVFSSYCNSSLSPVKRWKVIANHAFFYLIIEAATTNTNTANPQLQARNWEFYFFGDFISEINGDYFNTVLRATRTVNLRYSDNGGGNPYQYKNVGNPTTETSTSFTPLMYSGTSIAYFWGLSICNSAYANSGPVSANMWYAGMPTGTTVTYAAWSALDTTTMPCFENGNGVSGKIQLSKVMLIESSPQQNRTVCRGWLPGFYAPLSASPWDNWQILDFYGGQYSGYSFLTLSLDDYERRPENPGPCAAISINVDWGV